MGVKRKFPGIYRICHLPTGHFYIGKSTDVTTRWKGHLNSFFMGSHVPTLQALWDSSHYDNWSFSVIKFCKVKELAQMEKKYIDLAAQSLFESGNTELLLNTKDNPFKKGGGGSGGGTTNKRTQALPQPPQSPTLEAMFGSADGITLYESSVGFVEEEV